MSRTELDDASARPSPAPPGALSAVLRELARAPSEAAGAWGSTLRPGVVIGRFELIRELGRGGFGVVFEARDRDLHRTVAFKAVRGGSELNLREERLLREAEAAARLAHPNIVTLYDVGRGDHGPYLVLEYLRGESLAKRLDRGRLPVPEALHVAVEVAKGVAHAHAQGVVHRDLTPGNVFLCEHGQVKVLDFGLAHAFGHRKMDGGTPDYMAPEQRRGAPEDERTDVFALGVLLFRMLAGEVPARADRLGADGAAALHVPGLPALGAFVGRMLATDPTKRPRDAAEVLDALLAFERELPLASHFSPPSREQPGRARVSLSARLANPRHRIAVIIVLGVLAATAGVASMLHRSEAGRSTAVVPSVAVLPFADVSPQRDQEYFSDGVAEEIMSALAQVEGLRVIGRTSSFSFKGKSDDMRSIGEKLGVGTVLEGSVRKAGARARITARLVRVEDGASVWSQTYDRDLSDVLAVQEEIARAVVAAVAPRLRADGGRKTGAHHAVRPEVYDRYLFARALHRHPSYERVQHAVEIYEEVVAFDPQFAPASAWLALGLYAIGEPLPPDSEQRRALHSRAFVAAENAIAVDPEFALGWSARGYLRARLRWDWDGAQSDFRRALSLAPGDADVIWYHASAVLNPMGRLAEAHSAFLRAVELDPLSFASWIFLGRSYAANGQWEQARLAAERALRISPDHELAIDTIVYAYLLEGRAEDALRVAGRGRDAAKNLTFTALAQHSLGNARASEDARAALEKTRATTFAYQLAQVHAWRGERDLAFEWLDRAYAQRDPGLIWLRMDNVLSGLRDDPRYAAFLRKLRVPVD